MSSSRESTNSRPSSSRCPRSPAVIMPVDHAPALRTGRCSPRTASRAPTKMWPVSPGGSGRPSSSRISSRGVGRGPADRARRLEQVARRRRSSPTPPRSSRRGCRAPAPNSSMKARASPAVERRAAAHHDPQRARCRSGARSAGSRSMMRLQHHRHDRQHLARGGARSARASRSRRSAAAARPCSPSAGGDHRSGRSRARGTAARGPGRPSPRRSARAAGTTRAARGSRRGRTRAPFGAPVVPEVRITVRPSSAGGVERRGVAARAARSSVGERRASVAVGPATTRAIEPASGLASTTSVNSPSWTSTGGLLAAQHRAQLGRGQRGVQQQRVGAELRRRRPPSRRTPAPLRHRIAEPVARPEPGAREAARDRVRVRLDLRVGDRAVVVDQGRLARRA